MANLDLAMEDMQELFRVMPESFRQIQLIAQARVIRELEEKISNLEESNAKGRKEEVSLHSKGKDAGKG